MADLTRRTVLGAVGATVAASGQSVAGGQGVASERGVVSGEGPFSAADVNGFELFDSLVVKRAIDTFSVERADGRFVFVDVTSPAAGPNPAPGTFSLRTQSGREIAPRAEIKVPLVGGRRQVTSDLRRDDTYRSAIETVEGLVFDVPAEPGQGLSLSVANHFTLPLPTATRAAVGRDGPQFDVDSVTFPSTVSGDELSVQLAVENTGRAGTFRAAVNVSDSWYAAYPVAEVVDAGTRTTVSATIPNLADYSGNPPKITVVTAENTYTERYDALA